MSLPMPILNILKLVFGLWSLVLGLLVFGTAASNWQRLPSQTECKARRPKTKTTKTLRANQTLCQQNIFRPRDLYVPSTSLDSDDPNAQTFHDPAFVG